MKIRKAHQLKAPRPTLQIIQDKFSARMKRGLGDAPVSCGPKCSACCHQWVGVMYLEAEEAVKEARRVGYEMPADRLYEQSEIATKGHTRESWFRRKMPCIFLKDDQTCAIHGRRPIACRAMVVRSDPKQCSDPRGTVEKYNTNDDAMAAYVSVKTEHVEQALVPVVAALPLMVRLVIEGRTPTALQKTEGVYGVSLTPEQMIGAPDELVDGAQATSG